MRVKQPEPFDREREYKPGERSIVNGTVLIATLWTPAAQRLADRFVVRLGKIFVPGQI